MSKKDREGMSKREMMREKRRATEQRNRLIAIGLIVIGALFLVFIVVAPMLQPVGAITTVTPVARPQADRNSTGDPNAPVKIVEFSDFQCPFCGRFSKETEQQLVETYVATGKVYFTYRSVGGFIGAESVRAAQAAYCAADQAKFWEYHDMIFANQAGENAGAFKDSRLTAFAETLGLDMTAFKSCFNNDKYKDQVDQDAVAASDAGVQSTPTFILSYVKDGQTVSETLTGAQPFSTFQQEIDKALAAMGK
jgi:protein-disulfide isomerase